MLQKDKRREDLEDFILHYKTAAKHKWTREQLAEFFGIKSASVARRALSVKHQLGITLPTLRPDSGKLVSAENVQKFRDETRGDGKRLRPRLWLP